jgi:polyisoprenoid-binding protein YceI
MHHLISRRYRGLAAALLVPIVAVAIQGFALTGGAVAQDAAVETDVTAGVLEAEPALLDCTTIGTDASEIPAPANTYQLVSEESAARYKVKEELATIGATEAIGETNAIIGQILFDETGMPLACSRWDVDLRTLQSDEPRRDNYLYTNTLETEEYPLATFVLTGVEGLEEPLADGEETTFFLTGDLTLHGVTRSVAWEVTAALDGETLTGSAAMTFEMPDFEIETPSAPIVVGLEETVRLEVDLTANQAV